MATKRLQLLQQTATEKEQQQLSFTIQQDKLQAQADLLETEKQVGLSQQKLEDLKSAPTLSLGDVIKAQQELEGYERGVVAIKALIKELF